MITFMPRNEYAIKLGCLIRKLRKAQGFSQESFAEKVGVHRTYMGAIERGEKSITVETLSKATTGLGISLSEFFSLLEKEE